MTARPSACLNLDRAVEYLGDMQGVLSLLGTLRQSLQDELPQIQSRLDAGDLPGIHQLLHQIKGFAPVFCTDELVAEVVRVEGLSKSADLQTVCAAYAHLGPQLQQLLAEVGHCLTQTR